MKWMKVGNMYRGLSAVSIDAKGRMAIPARYRGHLQESSSGQVIVTIETESPCLLLYPLLEWELIEQKIAALPSYNPSARRIQRLLIGHATELELDAQGRILLPTLLRDYAGLNNQAMLVGQGKKFEIWSEAQWNDERAASLTDKNSGELPQEINNISL